MSFKLDLTGLFGVALALVLGVVVKLLPSRSVEAPLVRRVGSDRSLAQRLLPSLKIALCSDVFVCLVDPVVIVAPVVLHRRRSRPCCTRS